MLDRRLGGWGLRKQRFIHFRHKGKGKDSRSKKEKGKDGGLFWVRIPLGNQTARTHARNETKPFPGWTHPQPPIFRIKTFAWEAWELVRHNFRFGISLGNSVGIFGLETFAWNLRLGAFAWDLRLGELGSWSWGNPRHHSEKPSQLMTIIAISEIE